MSPLAHLPSPRPTRTDAPFWAGCEARKLLFPRCSGSGRWLHPSLPIAAPNEGKIEWTEAHGPALIFTYTRVYYAAHESVENVLPYDVIVVDFPDCGDVRLLSNLVGYEEQTVTIGAELRLVWDTSIDGLVVPRFKLKAFTR